MIGYNQVENDGRSTEVVCETSDRFAYYRGKYVEIVQQGANTCGRFVGSTAMGTLLVSPFIEQVSLLQKEQEKYKIPCELRWNTGLAAICSESVQSILERGEELMNAHVKKYSIKKENLK